MSKEPQQSYLLLGVPLTLADSDLDYSRVKNDSCFDSEELCFKRDYLLHTCLSYETSLFAEDCYFHSLSEDYSVARLTDWKVEVWNQFHYLLFPHSCIAGLPAHRDGSNSF